MKRLNKELKRYPHLMEEMSPVMLVTLVALASRDAYNHERELLFWEHENYVGMGGFPADGFLNFYYETSTGWKPGPEEKEEREKRDEAEN